MNGATLSVLGMYQYDNSLFDNFQLPAGISRDNVRDNIFLDCAELEVLYSDFDVFKYAIGAWSSKMLPKWNRIDSVLKMSYNPLENYDRMENWTDNGENNTTTNAESSSDSTGAEQATSNSENTLTVAGFNSNEWGNREKNDGSSESGVNSVAHSEGTAGSTGNSVTEQQHEGRIHGNIGVTTSQQMLREEVSVADINIVSIIVEDFKARFCLGVY